MKKKELNIVIFMGILMAFLGWLIENIAHIFSHGYIDSRYFLFPFISSYSLIVFVWYFLIRKWRRLIDYEQQSFKKKIVYNIVLFFMLALAVFIIEISIGNAIDYLFGVELWNYSGIWLHLTKYAALPIALVFGLEAFILVKWIFPKVYVYLENRANINCLKNLNIICTTIIIFDTFIFWLNLILYKQAIIYWKIFLF